ncbi:MAG: hypothetical protein KC493_16985 [Bacteriovoracaceae bacterium]|nr:hypothetical protein [Bacteriovoracaceae bacterium]
MKPDLLIKSSKKMTKKIKKIKKRIKKHQLPLTKDEIGRIAKLLVKFNNLEICSIVVGTMFAGPFKTRLKKINKQGFPILFIGGEAGSGKTQTLVQLIIKFNPSKTEPINAGNVTPFTLISKSSSCNTSFLLVDEFKPSKFDQRLKRLWSNFIRTNYDGQTTDRGHANQTITTYVSHCAAVIIGEAIISEPAAEERTVKALFSKAESIKYIDSFNELSKQSLDTFFMAFLVWSLKYPLDEVQQVYENQLLVVSEKLQNRHRHNAATVRVGLYFLNQFFLEQGCDFDVSSCLDAVDNAQLNSERATGSYTDVENILLGICSMLESLSEYDLSNFNRENMIFLRIDQNDPSKSYIIIRVNLLYPMFRQWALRTGFDDDVLDQKTFSTQLHKSKYCKAYNSVKYFGGNCKAHTLYLGEMQKSLLLRGLLTEFELSDVEGGATAGDSHSEIGNYDFFSINRSTNEIDKGKDLYDK